MEVYARYYLPVAFRGKRSCDEWFRLAEALSVIRDGLPDADLAEVGWKSNPQFKMTADNGQSVSVWSSCLMGLSSSGQRIIIRSRCQKWA